MPSSQVIEAIAVTAELCGRTFSQPAAIMFANDLDGFPDNQILSALSRCRKECKGLLTVQDVVSRIDDGRPGVEEAWSMLPHDEATTAVWTDEMCRAWSIALPLMDDKVAARMAFKEAYAKELAGARNEKRMVRWSASLGHDKYGREAVLLDAVEKGRLGAPHVRGLLPYHEISEQADLLLRRTEIKMLSNDFLDSKTI